MEKRKNSARITLWVNRCVAVLVVALMFALPAIMKWYTGFRFLTDAQQLGVMIAFYCCSVVIGWALWNMDRLLRNILAEQVFVRKNVRCVRQVQGCCAVVSVLCGIAGTSYLPLLFLMVIMAFLCLVVSVVANVMDAAVTIREENDLTV